MIWLPLPGPQCPSAGHWLPLGAPLALGPLGCFGLPSAPFSMPLGSHGRPMKPFGCPGLSFRSIWCLLWPPVDCPLVSFWLPALGAPLPSFSMTLGSRSTFFILIWPIPAVFSISILNWTTKWSTHHSTMCGRMRVRVSVCVCATFALIRTLYRKMQECKIMSSTKEKT